MLRGSNVPGCCLYVSLLLSRIGLVVISEDVSDSLPRFRNERTFKLQPTRKTNFNEFGSKRFQENVVETEPIENNPENRISDTFNAHSGFGAKRFKIGHISTEVQAKRLRRNAEHSFFDEDEIVKLTDIALQQCPYNTFCHRNRTQVPEFRHGYGSCCTNCYCDEQCGDRMDCCWDFLDEIKITEKNDLTCITPVILPANEQLGNEPMYSYLMIDSCHGNTSYKCREENAAPVGPLFPTYSPTTSLIYFNKYCASCNGENDSTPWDMYVTCNDPSSPSGIALIRDLKRKQCRVRFRPPKKANIDKFVCDTEIINTCNLAEGTSEIDINLEKACRLTKAYVNSRNPDGTFRTVTYANIFCKLCNGHLHYSITPCRVMVDELPRSPTSAKLTTLIDWRLLSDSIASDVTDTSEGRVRDNSEERQTHKTCRENEVKHPTKEDCRKIICPNGAINTPDGCKLFAKTWYVTGYEIHVIMTPTSERRIPLPEFNGHAKNVTDINEWLDTKGLDINHLMMYAEEREENNITYLGVLNMKLGSNRYPLKAPKLLKAIDKSLSRQWVITVNKIVYTYDIQFDKYENFVQTGEFYRTRWIGTDKGLSSAASNEPFKLPKVYTPVLFRAKMVGLQMNKMYFCERIELIKKEWSGAYSGIWLNVTGSGNDTFLGDGEYSYEQDSFGTNDVIVQICVDDFLSQFVSTENTAHSFGYTIPLISISVLIQF